MSGLEVGELVTLESSAPREDRESRLRRRLLDYVRAGVSAHNFFNEAERRWLTPPGACPVSSARQFLGGRTTTAEFRGAIDALLSAGELLEVWLFPRGHEEPKHILFVPGCSAALSRPVMTARGRADVLAAEQATFGLARKTGADPSGSAERAQCTGDMVSSS